MPKPESLLAAGFVRLMVPLAVAASCASPGARAAQAVAEREFVLDRLDIKCVSCGWGMPRWGKSVEGNPIRVGGKKYRHGLGTHANSRLVIDLRGKARRFSAVTGVDDEMADTVASVGFIVTGDGRTLWQSGILKAGEARTVMIPLDGVRTLALEVTDGGDGGACDHADWADAKLLMAGPDPEAVWWEGKEALDSLKLLRRFQNGEPVIEPKEAFERIRRIEDLYPRIPSRDRMLRPLLDGIVANGDLPPGFRGSPVPPPGAGTGRRRVRLDEFGPTGFTCGWGSPRVGKSIEGNPLRIRGREYSRGVGTHANSRFVVRLFGEAERFSATVGVDDEPNAARGSVVFTVSGGGRVLWTSGILKSTDPPKPVDVDLRGIDDLVLEVANAGDGNGNDHADWADAAFTITGRAPRVVIPPVDTCAPVPASRPMDRIRLTWATHVAMGSQPRKMRKPPSADCFPGPVPGNLPRVTRAVPVDPGKPFWHPTGLYAPPGEPVTVTMPGEHADRDIRIRIGCHTDELWNHENLSRAPAISTEFRLASARTVVANPFGGLVYVVVPARYKGRIIHQPVYWDIDTFQWFEPIAPRLAPFTVTISGAVEAPYFRVGVTSEDDWRRGIRSIPVPVAELEGRHVVLQVPAADVRSLDRPGDVVAFWDTVVRLQAELAGWGEPAAPMFVTLDTQIVVGGGHSGYPIMARASERDWSASILHPETWRAKGAWAASKGGWGVYHEMGHNHQWSPGWTFQGMGEMTNELFSMYCDERVSGSKAAWGDRAHRLKVVRQVFSPDPRVPGRWHEVWQYEKLVLFINIIEAFGWDPIKSVIRSYRDRPGFPDSEAGRGTEFMVRLSRAVGRNLYPLFRGWGIEMTEEAGRFVADLPVWMSDLETEVRAGR